jgi:UDP-N-acetylglucosamine:LPS N-acetylglucosamine transferase
LALLKWTWLRLIRRLEPAIRDFAPDAIISTQMIPAAMVSFLKQRRKLDVPVLGVVTDFGVHDFWKQPGVDAYCVAHQSIATAMADSCGFADVVATGVPLMPGFAALPSQAEARRQLQLPADVPVVLVLGGGLGLSVDTAAAHLLDRQSETHLIVMPGRNANMQKSLASLTARQPQRLRVCEWTEQMQLFIRASDLIVGKPGGVTVAEALACGRPLLATRSLGGQEGFNVRFLEQHDVGGLVPDGELLQGVDALIHDRERLLQMQRHAWLLGHREGAQRVAALTLELIFEHQQNRFAARL